MTDPTEPAEKATVAETARLKAIIASDAGRGFPELARTIAFTTRLSAREAASVFDAVLIDLNRFIVPDVPAVPAALSYAEKKRQAGALGTTPFAPETSAHGNGGGDE